MSDAEQEVSGEQLGKLAEMAMEQARRVGQKIPLLGPITWLMMQQSATRHGLISDLEWRVMPPLVLDQAKLYLRQELPIAFVSWARLNEEAAQRYREPPHRLAPADWHGGDQVWLIDLLAPYGGVQDIFDDLRKNIFAGQIIRQLAPMSPGAAKVIRWEPLEATAAQ